MIFSFRCILLHFFLSSVFSFRYKHNAFTICGSTGHTLWFNRPRNWGHLNRAVKVKLGPSYSDIIRVIFPVLKHKCLSNMAQRIGELIVGLMKQA